MYRGIYINGITGFETSVRQNTVGMKLDNVFNGTQHGIDISNTWSSNNAYLQYDVSENIATGTNLGSLEAVYFASLNFGLQSPVISCNTASVSYQGFVFSGPNTPTTSLIGTQWFGNSMAALNRGMVLTTTAIIGAQGNPTIGCGNMWLGSVWSATNPNTYTQNSDAGQSPLYCAPQSSLLPAYNVGNPTPINYQNATNALNMVSGGGNYSCTDPSAKSATFQSTFDGYSENLVAVVNFGLYRFLRYNDSIQGNTFDLNTFFSDCHATNIETLADVEQYLNDGNYSSALSTLSGITPANDIESNYIQFYTIYANYQHDIDNRDPFSGSDSLDLLTLAYNCPEEGGNCIYQARALYEYIFATVPYYPGCDSGTGAKYANVLSSTASKNSFQPELFRILPNPNEGSFIVQVEPGIHSAVLAIYDCTGGLKVQKVIQFQNVRSNVQVDLPSGLYEFVLTSVAGEIGSLKVVISK